MPLLRLLSAAGTELRSANPTRPTGIGVAWGFLERARRAIRRLRRTWNRRSVVACVAVGALGLGGCATVDFNVPRPVSHALDEGGQTPLGRAFVDQVAAHPGRSGFQLLASGHQAFISRAATADLATRTLDLQYFSVGDDLTTDLLLDRIGAAAARGVRVRILLDDVQATTRTFARRAAAQHTNVEVRLFNPFLSLATSNAARLREFALDGERLNRRMHNKLWVADNVVGIFGSRNLGDEYFDTNAAANFVDIDLLAVGPVVQEMSRAFDAYWNSAAAWPAQAFGRLDATTARRERTALQGRIERCHGVPPCHWLAQNGTGAALHAGQLTLAWAGAAFAYDPPDDVKLDVPTGIAHEWQTHGIADRQRGELLIVSPYVIPDEEGLEHLSAMKAAGDRVAVLTNSLASTDSIAAHAGYSRYRGRLLREGVELYEIRPAPGGRHRAPHRWGGASPGSLHAKFVVQDRRHVVVGSRNQDPRSRTHNTESWIVVDSPELAAELAALFEDGTELHHAYRVRLHPDGSLLWLTEEEGGTVEYVTEPSTGFWLRLWREVLSLVLPEHLL